MPMYEYKCDKPRCAAVFTELAAYDDVVQCPRCGKGTGVKQIATTYHPVFVHRQGKFAMRRNAVKSKKKK